MILRIIPLTVKPFKIIILCIILSLAFYVYFHKGKEDKINLKQLLAVSISAAIKGGNLVKDVYKNHNLTIKSKGNTKEGAKIPVTQADLMSHIQMSYGLRNYFPLLKWVISEEHDDQAHGHHLQKIESLVPDVSVLIDPVLHQEVEASADDITVWIDPLDATQEFTEGLVEYVTTMVCVAIRGQPIIGVIHQPFLNRTYWGWVGRGHSPNLSPPKAHPAAQVTPRILVSRSHAGRVREILGKLPVTPAGGSGYKALQLSLGNADAYVHITQIQKWDICAPHALLLSLNGELTPLGTAALSYSPQASPIHTSGFLASFHTAPWLLDKLQTAFRS